MNEDAIREAQLYKFLENYEVPDVEELQCRVIELQELAGGLSVYLQELLDIALGKDLVTTIPQIMHDIKNDGITLKRLREINGGLFSKPLEESLK